MSYLMIAGTLTQRSDGGWARVLRRDVQPLRFGNPPPETQETRMVEYDPAMERNIAKFLDGEYYHVTDRHGSVIPD